MGYTVLEPAVNQKLDSACKTALKFLADSYRNGQIFSALPKPGDSLSSLEILSVLALSPTSRKEIFQKYLHQRKLDLAAAGVFAWTVINTIDEFSGQEKAAFEDYFTKYEERFDDQINQDGLLSTDNSGNWLKSAVREGSLVENQAYYAKILDVLSVLTDDDMYEFKKKRLIRAVRENLDGAYVLDRKDSLEVRTNNFIAAFFAPELFKSADLENTFDASLKSSDLWLHWGGLTTLSQSDSNYTDREGESWFFVNNIAAIVLFRLDNEKYAEKIEKILRASAESIRWQEHTGRPCELTFSMDKKIKVHGLYGLTLATFIYLYRLVNN